MSTTEANVLKSTYEIQGIFTNVSVRLPKPGDPFLKSLPVPDFNPAFDATETTKPISLFRRGVFQGKVLVTVNYYNFQKEDFDGQFHLTKVRFVKATRDGESRWIVDVFNHHPGNEANYKLSFNMSTNDILDSNKIRPFIQDTGNDIYFGITKM